MRTRTIDHAQTEGGGRTTYSLLGYTTTAQPRVDGRSGIEVGSVTEERGGMMVVGGRWDRPGDSGARTSEDDDDGRGSAEDVELAGGALEDTLEVEVEVEDGDNGRGTTAGTEHGGIEEDGRGVEEVEDGPP